MRDFGFVFGVAVLGNLVLGWIFVERFWVTRVALGSLLKGFG